MAVPLKIGILELLTGFVSPPWTEHLYNRWFRRHFVSIMPQAVAVWGRKLGHRVHYASYYGQKDPLSLLPDGLDIVFIATYTQASPLAYALAKLYRRNNTLTVIGGPHARAFPEDCLRFFDFAVQDCDKNLIEALLRSSFDRPSLLTSRHLLQDIPSVEERFPEIAGAGSSRGQPSLFTNVPMLTSLGCPYRCDFCVDWNRPYVLLPLDRLAADLRFVSRHMPKAIVAYHDPNFGVEFDRVLDTIETIPAKARNPYAMGCSLSVLKGSRLDRLRQTNCVYVGAGVESWRDYSQKAGTESYDGIQKLERVIGHFRRLHACIPSLGACFIFGTDKDQGEEPINLTKNFIRRVPYVWPGISIPVPYGGTPLHGGCLREGRILRSMPFSFYAPPYLVLQPKNYPPLEYYEKLIKLGSYAVSLRISASRIAQTPRPGGKLLQALRTLAFAGQLAEMRRIRNQLKQDKEFRAFHEGRSNHLPEFYRQRFRQRLGPYAEFLSDNEMTPEFSPPPTIPTDPNFAPEIFTPGFRG